MEAECFFKNKIASCPGSHQKLSDCQRIQKIMEACELRGHTDLLDYIKDNFPSDSVSYIRCHKNCVSSYISCHNLAPFLRKRKPKNITKKLSPEKRCKINDTNFDFKKHCLFCLEVTECFLDYEHDKKTPSRYRVPSSKVNTAKMGDGQDYIVFLMNKCEERNDTLGQVVRDRLLTANGDLVAVEARYHRKCSCLFHKPANSGLDIDRALFLTFQELDHDRTKVWNSIDIMEVYKRKGGKMLSRRTLLEKVEKHFGEDILCLRSNGIATLVVFRKNATKTMNLVTADDDDEDATLKKIARNIVKELKEVKDELTSYNVHIDKTSANECCSDLLCKLLSKIHVNFSCNSSPSLPSIMVGNIVASVATSQATPLQIALGVLMSDHKSLINILHKFRITCSYDEVRRFLRSAAVQASRYTTLTSLSDSSVGGLVQVIVDNFDAVINSQNCRLDCHNLAMIVTQAQCTPLSDSDAITRLSKEQMKKPIDLVQEVVRYTGPRKPAMPLQACRKLKPSDVLKKALTVSLNRAKELDFDFLLNVLDKPETPEYNGFNTNVCRKTGMMPAKKSAVRYMPLINMTPADPDTVYTAIIEGLRIVQEANQDFLVLTADQQIYKVIVDILFANPNLLTKVIPILGLMHFVMDFVSCIGTLMTESGLKAILCKTFGSVEKMMEGKKYPQNVRALRLLTEELLRPVFKNNELNSMASLEEVLTNISASSRTTKAWTELVIKPTLLLMQFIRATHEPDYPLLIYTMDQMLPYFFAAHKHNYARYGLFFRRSLTWLPSEVEQQFVRGEQILHHMKGLWNGIPSDQFIETTWMKRGKGPSGIIGDTQNPQTVATWSYSQHAVITLTGDLQMMTEEDSTPKLVHKEESKGRIDADAKDRQSLRETLQNCIDPMDPDSHPHGALLNVVTGAVARQDVNIDRAVTLGQEHMEAFESSWPEGFYVAIKKQVVTFSDNRKAVKVGDATVIDQEAIYARVIGLMVSHRDVDFGQVLSCELAAYPPSMFHSDGSMRLATGKSCLKKCLGVETSRGVWGEPTVIVVDVSAVLWTIHWHSQGTVHSFVESFKTWIANHLSSAEVHLIQDRYYDFSTKSSTRAGRIGKAGYSRVYKLTAKSPLPPRNAILKCTANKVQLNLIIFEQIINDQVFLDNVTQDYCLIMSGVDPVPIVVNKGRKGGAIDLYSTHEEADIRLAKHALWACKTQNAQVSVISDDTDVFALLCYHYQMSGFSAPLIMQSPVYGRACFDIAETAKMHPAIMTQILAIHAISGCDTVAACHGIGKTTTVTISKKGFLLNSLGVVDVLWDDVLKETTEFMVAAYDGSGLTMSECRQWLWVKKTGRSVGAPKLCSLPPTTEAFAENMKRAHFQLAQWYAALDSHPPSLNPCDYGWEADSINKSLSAVPVPTGVLLAPDYVLRLIRCGCDSASACKSGTCRCTGKQIPCSIFCACIGVFCHNKFTSKCHVDDEDDDNDIVHEME